MDFRLSNDQRQLRDAARAFAQGEMHEIAHELEKTDKALEWLILAGQKSSQG